MKILFLDVDGVLNTPFTATRIEALVEGRRTLYMGLEPSLVERAQAMIARIPDLKVVLSSSWRLIPEMKAAYEKVLPCYDVTVVRNFHNPRSPEFRGTEVKEWLSGHPEVTRYACIDDFIGFPPDVKCFFTSPLTGLTEGDAEEIVTYLNAG